MNHKTTITYTCTLPHYFVKKKSLKSALKKTHEAWKKNMTFLKPCLKLKNAMKKSVCEWSFIQSLYVDVILSM